MWNLPRPGIEPLSPALAEGFFTTQPPGKPQLHFRLGALFFFECTVLNTCRSRLMSKNSQAFLFLVQLCPESKWDWQILPLTLCCMGFFSSVTRRVILEDTPSSSHLTLDPGILFVLEALGPLKLGLLATKDHVNTQGFAIPTDFAFFSPSL